ncbi:MAG TPA: hypothetical protein VF458_02790 [Ktedonobacteraceae bacterium]
MAIRIVNHTGIPHNTKVLDAESGEDLTNVMRIQSVSLTLEAGKDLPEATLTVHAPQIDITLQESTFQRVCPYCGHKDERTIHSIKDL